MLDIPVVAPALDVGLGMAFDGYVDGGRIVEGPLENNKTFGDAAVTMGMIHHAPGEYDGHFVAFQNTEAAARISGFFDSFFSSGVARVLAPESP